MGVEDDRTGVETITLGKWERATIPQGSLEETGLRVPSLLNLWFDVLPPDGRVFLVAVG